MLLPQSPHRRNPDNKYGEEKVRRQSPRRLPPIKLDRTPLNLLTTFSQSSSETIRSSGTSETFHSSRGRLRLIFRPVRGSRTLRVRFHMTLPRYRSLCRITYRQPGDQDACNWPRYGIGLGTLSAFKPFAICFSERPASYSSKIRLMTSACLGSICNLIPMILLRPWGPGFVSSSIATLVYPKQRPPVCNPRMAAPSIPRCVFFASSLMYSESTMP